MKRSEAMEIIEGEIQQLLEEVEIAKFQVVLIKRESLSLVEAAQAALAQLDPSSRDSAPETVAATISRLQAALSGGLLCG